MAEIAQEEKKQKEVKKVKPEYIREKKSGEVVRIHSTDIDGSKNLLIGISRIKGVGYAMANAIVYKLGIDRKRKLTTLSDTEIETIENAIANPDALKIPHWMFNRQKDMDSGKDIHLHTIDLVMSKKSDIDMMGETKSYKGLRHSRGQKVRGQRTASTGRGKAAVGVIKKKNMPGQVKDDKKK